MKLINSSIFLALLFCTSQAFALPTTILTFDTKEARHDSLPRNFRDLSSINLNAIASGQFSEDELAAVRKKYPNEKIIIVDLRRESHGFVNGDSVSWRAAFEKSNENKSAAKIIADEKYELNLAQKNKQIIVNKVLETDLASGWYKEVQPELIAVQKTSDEEILAKKNGFLYKRFPVRDHAKPDDAEFKNMIAFLKNLPQNQKIYVHCAAGKGRTTTFLTLFDIIKNGKNIKLKNIFKRQSSLGGAKLDDIDDKEEWRRKLSEERLKMIEDFYAEETAGRS